MALTQVSSEGIKDAQVKTADILDANITTAKVADNAITGAKVADNLDIPDNNKIRFGTGNDLEIYHSGSHSYIKDTGTGYLLTLASGFAVQNAAGTETILSMAENGSVDLYYDDSKKFETTSSGCRLGDNVQLNFGTDEDGDIYHDGSQMIINNATGTLKVRSNNLQLTRTDNEVHVNCVSGNQVELYYSGNKRLETTSTGVTVSGSALNLFSTGSSTLTIGSTNASGAYLILDGDSNGDGGGSDYSYIVHDTSGDLQYVVDNPAGTGQHIFKTGGATERLRITSAGKVGIGDTNPDRTVDIVSAEGGNCNVEMRTTNNTGWCQLIFSDTDDGYRGSVAYSHTNDFLALYASGGERLRINTNGQVHIGCTDQLSDYASNRTKLSVWHSGDSGGYLELGGDQTASSYSSGTILFCNTNNSSSVRHVGMQRAEIVTSDNNAGDDSGADLVFFARAEGGNLNNNFKIKSDRNVEITDGNLVVANGHGIDFSATASSGASELFADYEHGTYQPTVTGHTSGSWNVTSYTYLSYTKIGRLVHIGGYLNISSESSPNGDVYISLPFAIADLSHNAEYSAITCSLRSHGGSNLYNMVATVTSNNSIQLLAVNGSGTATWLNDSHIGSSWNVRLGGCYVSSA